jgi:hypothetical protein
LSADRAAQFADGVVDQLDGAEAGGHVWLSATQVCPADGAPC